MTGLLLAASCIIFALLLGAISSLISVRRVDVIQLFVFSVAAFYGLRLALITTGWDSLHPDYLFVRPAETAKACLECLLIHVTRYSPSLLGVSATSRDG